jgi:predicted metal-dependent phosphoesterase TrpH
LSVADYAAQVHRHGGFITHAHPFREAFYISRIRLLPELVDAVEVINASHTNPSYNAKALQYAKENNLLRMSGSDSHAVSQLFGGGVAFDRKMDSIEDLINTVRSDTGYQLLGR